MGRCDNFSGLTEKYRSGDRSLSNWDRVFRRDANFGNFQLVTETGHDFFNHMHVKKNIVYIYVCMYVEFGFSVSLRVLDW